MAEPARIAFAIPELDSAGPDRVFFELLCGLDRSEFMPQLIVSREGGRYYAALPSDVEKVVVGGGRYPVLSFARAVDRIEPDVVMSTLRMNLTASLARFVQRRRPPLIARQANAFAANFAGLKRTSLVKHRIAEMIVRRSIRMPGTLIAQSNDMAAELARYSAPRQRIEVIGNPVSLDEIDTACAKQKLSGPVRVRGEPSLIAVGRLASQKGFDILLTAFAHFRKQRPGAELTILGEGPDRAALEAQARTLGIEGSVHFPGQCNNVLAQVSAADIFVSSSRYEGFSNAILEAMALGRVVVATNCEGATKDMIVDGATGVLVEPDDAVALSAGLSRAMTADHAAMGTAARKHVGDRFSRDKIVRAYAAVFRSVLTPDR
jgi:glycosyltransferase involved in cell wall biosynthesis